MAKYNLQSTQENTLTFLFGSVLRETWSVRISLIQSFTCYLVLPVPLF